MNGSPKREVVGIGIVSPSRETDLNFARHTHMLTFEFMSASVTMLPPQLPTSESRSAPAVMLGIGRSDSRCFMEQIRSCLSAVRKQDSLCPLHW